MDNSSAQSYPEDKIQEWLDELRPFLYKLLDTWSIRRLDNETRDSYLTQAKEHVQDLMTEMISESEDKTQNLVKEIKHLMETLDKLSREVEKKIDLSPYEELPLDLVKTKLNDEVHKLKLYKEDIINRFKKLRQKEHDICKKMGVRPIAFDKKLITEVDIEKFSHYLNIQEMEKNRLEKEFLETRERIINMMNNLKSQAESEIQLQVYNYPEKFVYTKENMQFLSEWEKQLKVRIELIEKRVKEKRDEVKSLWSYLEEPIEYCEEFLNKYSDSSSSTYKALEAEIERCKVKRAENIAKYVGKMREELENLWDLCKYSEEQRNNFVPIHSQNYTDSLLTLHELEVDRLRTLYEENKKIFELVEKFELIIERMKILDRRAMDPDRLHNRGGQLLAEEKERKLANKKLPKIQEQITESLEEYEQIHGDKFTLNGLTVHEYFKKVWDEYNKEKENIKSEVKKQAKDKSTKKTPLSSSKKTLRTLSIRQIDPSRSVKRKLLDESTASSHTMKGQAASADKSKKKRTPNYVVKRGKFGSRKSLNQSVKSRQNVSKLNADENTGSFNSSYEKFQEHLQQREDLRSSCIPNQLLLGVSGVTKMKTPVKTPAKPLRRVLRQAEVSTKSPKLLRPGDASSKSPGLLRPTNISTRQGTPNSRTPKQVKPPLTIVPGNMPLFL